MRNQYLATRLFNAPLLVERAKLDSILTFAESRLGASIEIVSDIEDAPRKEAYGPGDNGRERKSYFVTEDGIAVIDVMGPLVKRRSGGFLSGGPTMYGEIEEEYQDAIDDPAIKGVLLQVDSPGGECTGCFELADLMHAQLGKKPVVAAADGDAFSAAYAIASASDRLFVAKSGGVGSVGVWMMHADYSGALEKAKIKVTFIHYGARKIDGNPYEALSKEAHMAFQAEVDRIGEMFVATVSRNRGMKADAVKGTEAGLYFGENGVAIGFADQVGTVSDALAYLRAKVQSNAGAARSAANSTKKEKRMESNERPADTPKDNESAGEQQQAQQQAAVKAARAEGFAHAAKIVGLCALAGFTARKTQGFLKADASIESVQEEIVEARAGESGPEINSHILPSDGSGAGKSGASPIEQAAERLAQQHAARKGAK